jgi:hypothetical protein
MQYTMCAYVENYLAWILLPCSSAVFLTLISNHLDLWSQCLPLSPMCVHAGHLAAYTFPIAIAWCCTCCLLVSCLPTFLEMPSHSHLELAHPWLKCKCTSREFDLHNWLTFWENTQALALRYSTLTVFSVHVIILTVCFRLLLHQGLKNSPFSCVIETLWSTMSHAHFYLMGFKTQLGVFDFPRAPSAPQLSLAHWET